MCHGKVYENQSKSLILQFCFNICSGFKNKALFFKLLLKSVFQQIIYKIHDLASAKAFFRSYIFHYFREFLSQVGNLKQKQFFINLSIHLIPNSNFMGKSRIHKVVLKEERGQQYYQQCQGLNLSYSFTMASARNFSSYFLFLQNKNERKETFRIDTMSLKPLTRRRSIADSLAFFGFHPRSRENPGPDDTHGTLWKK